MSVKCLLVRLTDPVVQKLSSPGRNHGIAGLEPSQRQTTYPAVMVTPSTQPNGSCVFALLRALLLNFHTIINIINILCPRISPRASPLYAHGAEPTQGKSTWNYLQDKVPKTSAQGSGVRGSLTCWWILCFGVLNWAQLRNFHRQW